jgi:hypothetical protein
MRILYLSCHSTLEYDEVRLLRELGHYVFSPNAYLDPDRPDDGDGEMRPRLDLKYDPEDVALWRRIPGAGAARRYAPIDPALVARFDLVIVMDMANWLRQNWPSLSSRRVVWRTIGQSISRTESELIEARRNGLKILRYSPREATIPGFLGGDAIIRFYKDPKDFGGWNGSIPVVLTVNQAILARHQGCNFALWDAVTYSLPHRLIGPKNDGILAWTGKATFEEMKAAMRDHRAYFYVGSHPASYTLNFIEAWMTGIPVVAIGPRHGNAFYYPGHQLYEIGDLIQNGNQGLISDDPRELQSYLRQLLDNPQAGRAIGERGRAAAIAHFGYEMIRGQWKAFLGTL